MILECTLVQMRVYSGSGAVKVDAVSSPSKRPPFIFFHIGFLTLISPCFLRPPMEKALVSALLGDLPKSLIRFRWMVNVELASVWYPLTRHVASICYR